jgi:hypothetical protein
VRRRSGQVAVSPWGFGINEVVKQRTRRASLAKPFAIAAQRLTWAAVANELSPPKRETRRAALGKPSPLLYRAPLRDSSVSSEFRSACRLVERDAARPNADEKMRPSSLPPFVRSASGHAVGESIGRAPTKGAPGTFVFRGDMNVPGRAHHPPEAHHSHSAALPFGRCDGRETSNRTAWPAESLAATSLIRDECHNSLC